MEARATAELAQPTPGLDELANMTEAQRKAWDVMGGYAKEAAEEASVAWDQATRNIQSVLADQLFNGFDDGIKGMLRSFIDVIRRMAAEALAANLVEKMFGSKGKDKKGNWLSGILSMVIGAKGGSTSGVDGGLASGGWTTPGALHPINEQQPEFLMTAGRDRVVPLSKMAANGLGSGGGSAYAPSNTYNISTVMSPNEMAMILRQNRETTMAEWKQMQRDGALT
jgi:hypothetical protein